MSEHTLDIVSLLHRQVAELTAKLEASQAQCVELQQRLTYAQYAIQLKVNYWEALRLKFVDKHPLCSEDAIRCEQKRDDYQWLLDNAVPVVPEVKHGAG